MKIENMTINPLELSLDFKNPRFLFKLNNEIEMRRYFLKYEDALDLAKSITKYGMMPGDSVICTIEDDKMVVIEGNRRVSIMQMLLDRSLIPTEFIDSIPAPSPEKLKELEVLNVQIIENRELGQAVMANRHIVGIKQWKPLAKKKFFASRFDEGVTIKELSISTNITEGEIIKDISDFKFFINNYNKYVKDNPSFDKEITDIKMDRFIRIFTTKLNSNEGSMNAKDYLMMRKDDRMDYVSQLPDKLFVEFTQHVFEKAFDSKDEFEVNTRSTFDTIPDIEKWKSKIDNFRVNVPISSGSPSSTTNKTVPAGGPSAIIKTNPSGGPSAPKFMESLHWEGKLMPNNRDHVALIRIVAELHKLSIGNYGKDYVKYPTATTTLVRSAYEQGLKLLIKTAGLWDDYESKYNNPRDQTLSTLERFIESNKHEALGKDTPLWNSFTNIKSGNYRKFMNDCTHNVDFAYATRDKLELFAGEGLVGFLQGIIDKVTKNVAK